VKINVTNNISTDRRLFKNHRVVIIVLYIFLITFSFFVGALMHKAGKLNFGLEEILKSDLHQLPFNYLSGFFANPEELIIDIKHENLQKLAYNREVAITRGVLFPDCRDEVPAHITYNDKKYKVSIRLKGDLPDHWSGKDHWSFKIKVKGDKTIKGMKSFSIQHPKTRGYLNEWIFYGLLKHSNIIALRYDFLNVNINGKPWGLYAIDEHLEKRLLENNNLKEGPIVQFNTQWYWYDKPGIKDKHYGSPVEPYQSNKVLNDPLLQKQFQLANDLLFQFRNGDKTASKVFDVDKLSTFFALTDLLGNHHALDIDNLKFYYNPITSLLEPIGRDNQNFMDIRGSGLIGEERKIGETIEITHWEDLVFNDEIFYTKYVEKLNKISKKEFLDDYFNTINEQLDEKSKILHSSFPWYNFDLFNVLYENQKYIQDFLNPSNTLHTYINSYDTTTNTLKIKVGNIHSLPIGQIKLFSQDSIYIFPDEDVIIQSGNKRHPITFLEFTFKFPSHSSYGIDENTRLEIYYKILGSENYQKSEIFSWKVGEDYFNQTDFMRQNPNSEQFHFLIHDYDLKIITFETGSHSIEENLILPDKYKILIHGDTKIDLVKSSSILSYSPIIFDGEEDNPIQIFSSDSTGQGLFINSATTTSILNNVSFNLLNNPEKENWQLSGAVTFYESPVEIKNCSFSNNLRGDDYLNIIRSSFTISNASFVNVFSDAIDTDYCTGSIEKLYFTHIGNDAIDVSGSNCQLNNIYAEYVGDKVISVGERSQIEATNVIIENSEIGITCKDMSKAVINDISINNSKIGLCVFQKKSEFGPGFLEILNYSESNNEISYLFEKNSIAIINGITIENSNEGIKDILYGVKYGKNSK
jgi:hypothetical protein